MVIRMAKKPTMWMIKMAPSTLGRCLARYVLKRTARAMTAYSNSVPW